MLNMTLHSKFIYIQKNCKNVVQIIHLFVFSPLNLTTTLNPTYRRSKQNLNLLRKRIYNARL